MAIRRDRQFRSPSRIFCGSLKVNWLGPWLRKGKAIAFAMLPGGFSSSRASTARSTWLRNGSKWESSSLAMREGVQPLPSARESRSRISRRNRTWQMTPPSSQQRPCLNTQEHVSSSRESSSSWLLPSCNEDCLPDFPADHCSERWFASGSFNTDPFSARTFSARMRRQVFADCPHGCASSCRELNSGHLTSTSCWLTTTGVS